MIGWLIGWLIGLTLAAIYLVWVTHRKPPTNELKPATTATVLTVVSSSLGDDGHTNLTLSDSEGRRFFVEL
jgi:hypothetical protein